MHSDGWEALQGAALLQLRECAAKLLLVRDHAVFSLELACLRRALSPPQRVAIANSALTALQAGPRPVSPLRAMGPAPSPAPVTNDSNADAPALAPQTDFDFAVDSRAWPGRGDRFDGAAAADGWMRVLRLVAGFAPPLDSAPLVGASLNPGPLQSAHPLVTEHQYT